MIFSIKSIVIGGVIGWATASLTCAGELSPSGWPKAERERVEKLESQVFAARKTSHRIRRRSGFGDGLADRRLRGDAGAQARWNRGRRRGDDGTDAGRNPARLGRVVRGRIHDGLL